VKIAKPKNINNPNNQETNSILSKSLSRPQKRKAPNNVMKLYISAIPKTIPIL
jgi:hypothetical protein